MMMKLRHLALWCAGGLLIGLGAGCGPASVDPAATDPARVEYAHLAAEISQDYRMPGRTHNGVPNRAVLEAAAKSPSAPLAEAAQVMLRGLDNEQKILNDRKGDREALKSRAKDLSRRADQGEFVTKEVKPWWQTATGDHDEIIIHDESDEAKSDAEGLARTAENMTDEKLSQEAKVLGREILESFRTKAWTDLEPVAKASAGPVSKTPLADVLRADQTSFKIRNLGRALSSATIITEFVHQYTFPETTFRHVCYVPTWKPDQEIEVGGPFLVAAAKAGVKQSELGGVVQTTIRVYAKEAAEEPITVADGAAVEAVVRGRLHQVEIAISSPNAVSRQGNPPAVRGGKPVETPEERTQKWVASQLAPWAALLPAGSDLAPRVQRLLKDFRPVREELLAAGNVTFLDFFAAGKRYEGKLYNPARLQKISGVVGLLFVSRDAEGKQIRAELYDPDNPRTSRMFAGSIVDDYVTGRKMLVLAAVGPGGFIDPIRTITVRFKPDPYEKNPVWRASIEFPEQAVRDSTPISMFLKLVEPKAEQLALAQQRVKDNPQLTVPEIGPFAPPTRGKARPASPKSATANAKTRPSHGKPASPDAAVKNDAEGDGTADMVTRVTVDDVEYEYQGTERKGADVFVTLLVTSRKGEHRPPRGKMTLVDDDGNTYVGVPAPGSGAPRALREGVSVKLVWKFGPNPSSKRGDAPSASVTRYASLSVEPSRSGAGDAIEFRQVPAVIPNSK